MPDPAVIFPSPRSISPVVSLLIFMLSNIPDVPLNLDIVAESTLSCPISPESALINEALTFVRLPSGFLTTKSPFDSTRCKPPR